MGRKCNLGTEKLCETVVCVKKCLKCGFKKNFLLRKKKISAKFKNDFKYMVRSANVAPKFVSLVFTDLKFSPLLHVRKYGKWSRTNHLDSSTIMYVVRTENPFFFTLLPKTGSIFLTTHNV
ncbi:hypothetical protein BpHYR1_003946 [Brachionus plicatilis]|uniref:Uncharacterized protein n=1 Tax=Brachionus plicatilis TaxID=10195 RepID=A0A3M7S7K1_BRAPC|nr:hypothetical protein BpHYR1_003946 [Brachionus plicatilis]